MVGQPWSECGDLCFKRVFLGQEATQLSKLEVGTLSITISPSDPMRSSWKRPVPNPEVILFVLRSTCSLYSVAIENERTSSHYCVIRSCISAASNAMSRLLAAQSSGTGQDTLADRSPLIMPDSGCVRCSAVGEDAIIHCDRWKHPAF